MKNIFVTSEIGKLKTVLLHEPGEEIENLTPNLLSKLLFDDIPWLPLAVKEHQSFANVLRKNGVEVLYLVDLVAETIENNHEAKDYFITTFIKEAEVNSDTIENKLYDYLYSFNDTLKMVKKTMSGIKKSELPGYSKRHLIDYVDEFPFIIPPLPNLYFTRDPFSSIGSGVSINKMYTTTRSRETLYYDIIFKYHERFKNVKKYYERDCKYSIEGGDILNLSDKVVIVGISERTTPAAIEYLAKKLILEENYSAVLALDIPKRRTFMHLDTVFTQVDYYKFTIHPFCYNNMKIYKIENDDGKLKVTAVDDSLEVTLEKILGNKVTLIPCGGNDAIDSDREQWSDGANTFAIAPGKVVVYNRNQITNDILVKNGIEVYPIPSSELSRGRGGPRCMCMPIYREEK